MNSDPSIYAAHAVFWGLFGLTRFVAASRDCDAAKAPGAVRVSNQTTTATFSRTLLAFHMAAFAILYVGIGSAVASNRLPVWMPAQRTVASLVIGAGTALAMWALLYFRSWRFRAKLETGHELATGGPFRFFRHPIYMALNLLALGSAIWIPNVLVCTGFALMVIGSDLRGRSEEKLLAAAFGPAYRDYCARTARFLPGLY